MTKIALHGFTQSPEQWRGIFDGEIVAPWLPGHGPSADLSARSFDDAARSILELARSATDAPLLVGYSMGARLALSALAREPSLFKGAILIGVQPGLEEPEARAERRRWERKWIDMLEREGLESFLSAWEKLPLFGDQNDGPQAQAQAARRRSHTARGLAHALGALGLADMPNHWGELSKIPCPVELVVGEKDEKFRALAERALPRFPRARLHVIPGAGHNPLEDQPDETRALLRQLADS